MAGGKIRFDAFLKPSRQGTGMEQTAATPIPIHERLLLKFLDPPWEAFWRGGLGLITFLLYSKEASEVGLGSFALDVAAVLVSLRAAAAVVRAVLPFSGEVRHVWAERRALAKAYDSYQWRKLLWMGMGICLGAGICRQWSSPQLSLGLGCAMAGGAGAIIWSRRRKQDAFLMGRLTSR